jgi:hypothetical protein
MRYAEKQARLNGLCQMEVSEILEHLIIGSIPKNGNVDSAVGCRIISVANELADRIDAYAKQDREGPLRLPEFSAKLRLISWCYPINTKLVAASKVDRRSSMFCGPFFVSESSPWPQVGDKYYEPVIQVDTKIINSMSTANFGDGLLQLWVDGFLPDDYLVRVIPRDECTAENLSPVPECIDSEYFDEIERTGDSDLAWPAVHYKKRVPSVYVFEENFAKNLSWADGLEEDYSNVSPYITDTQIQDDLKKFVSIFPYDNPSTEPHFFGTFSPVQYNPIDANPTLLALEGGPCFSWNYGNAQISYSVDERGGITFGFACSCQ